MANTIDINTSTPREVNITGKWTWHDYYNVTYSWENAPDGVTLPTGRSKLKYGDSVTVDTTYTSVSEIDVGNQYYTFSGWNKSGNITVTENTVITGIWTAHDYYSVTYSWTNAPSGVTLPSTINKVKSGDIITVDTTYTSNSYKDFDSNYYTFSGWNKSGNITVNDNTTITGAWTSHNYLSVSYSWSNAPSGVTLPNSTGKLKPGASVTVDTTYTKNKQVDVGNKYYIFSGWNKSGNITVTDADITISGIWTAYDYYSVTYSWSNAPSGVTLPSNKTKLKSGTIVAVDSSYTSNSKVINNSGSYKFSGWNYSGNITVNSNVSISGSWICSSWSSLSIGSTFTLGKYQVGSETPWDIEWEIVHQESDYQIAMAKQIIDLRCFDAKEPNNSDSNRQKSGNNNWQYSNIEQWLNSDQSNWYSAQHSADAPPSSVNTNYNPYDTKPGFLYYWSDEEKAVLQDMTLTLSNNTKTDGGGSYTWTGKVWLPTYTQMSGSQNNSISEGTQFNKFTDNTSRIKTIHAMCAANNQYCIDKGKTEGTAWYYWESSAYPSLSYGSRYVYSDGNPGHRNAAYDGSGGVVPCICLPR